MKKFFFCYNNGVTAIVDEATLASIHKRNAIWQLFEEREKKAKFKEYWWAPHVASEGTWHLSVPIFTFVRQERFKESPWFTGDTGLMDALIEHIKERGDVFQDAGFYVPFSNGCEIGTHGKESMRGELSNVTTEKQFEEIFGVRVSELVDQSAI